MHRRESGRYDACLCHSLDGPDAGVVGVHGERLDSTARLGFVEARMQGKATLVNKKHIS